MAAPNRDERPVLVFDGDCGFCTTVARHFERRSRTPLRVVPWQRADLESLSLTPEMTAEQVYLVSGTRQFAGAECFAELMKIQGDPFHRAVAGVMRAPGIRRLSAGGYTLVARNRHRLPGGTPACKMD